MQPTNHKLNSIIGGLIDSVILAPRCPTCRHELNRLHDWHCEYQATFCYTCYDWVPLDDELNIACDRSKPCPKCETDMFAIQEIWEKTYPGNSIWRYTPHRWGCVCGNEEPYLSVSK